MDRINAGSVFVDNCKITAGKNAVEKKTTVERTFFFLKSLWN